MSDLVEMNEIVKVREHISNLESEMKKHTQLEIIPKHYFSNGVYAREIFIPKGALVVGKIHKHQNLNIMSKGKGKMLSIDGAILIEAPYTVVSSPGVKRAYYAEEDTVWTTILGTDEKDLEIIEEKFIAKTYDEVVMISEKEFKAIEESKCHL